MSLRVGAGEARGRRLLAPNGIRPTEGLVRAAIFNMIGPAVVDAAAVDLFAGSGALGIEAISRGARSAAFVERSRACASILRQNLDALGYRSRSRVAVAEVVHWLEAAPPEIRDASLVILDPPYDDATLAGALTRLDGLVKAGATVVAEHRHGSRLPSLERLAVARERRYGGTGVTLFRVAAAGTGP